MDKELIAFANCEHCGRLIEVFTRQPNGELAPWVHRRPPTEGDDLRRCNITQFASPKITVPVLGDEGS